MKTLLEFFAGGGMARIGLGPAWRCLFSNDIDPMKAAAYAMNFGRDHLRVCDIAKLTIADLPTETADLAWASFPCQDLSLAGEGKGLDGARSGTVWQFFRLMRALKEAGRAPRLITLENVCGWLTSHGGKDFADVATALEKEGYRAGPIVVDAELFVPQSRERVFLIGVREDVTIPAALFAEGQWRLPNPPLRNTVFSDLIEDPPQGVAWHTPAETTHIIDLMTPLHRQKVDEATKAGRRMVGTIYRRTRPNGEGGAKQQRAEVRFDNVAGCLRVPTGGSSRQTILVVEGDRIRSRLLSPREAARLMGLPDSYKLPGRYNDAYSVCGDGVCAPVVRHIATQLLEPILAT
jgi:DNA (cytosine-5)-methyltransferase 1